MITVKVVDGTIQYYDSNDNEISVNEVRSQLGFDEEVKAEANKETLKIRALASLVSNKTYTDRVNPTAAQNTAQIRALTRQVNGLLRVFAKQLSDISDA